MSMFANLKTEGLEEAQDRLGGFQVKPSDIYLATIKMAYGTKSDGGALGLVLSLDIGGGAEYSETLWVTNKKGENFSKREGSDKKSPLPGFTTADDICMLTTEKPLFEQVQEDKQVKVYDRAEGKEVPKAVPVLVDLIGKKVYLAIVAQTVNKTKKNESTGQYEPTPDVRDENTIEKAFHHELKVTMTEAKNGQDPAFFDAWLDKNKGVTRDRRQLKDGQGPNQGARSGRPGSNAAPVAGEAKSSTSSLFKK